MNSSSYRISAFNSIYSIVNGTAITAIGAYQKYISPKKGFSCAHRLLYGGESCSQYIKRMVVEHGLKSSIPIARLRFAECKVANVILRAERKEKRRRGGWNCDCEPDCEPDCGDCDCG
jgi:putative component of membrane protein insertase Oxa1/YidC/SpoIIIJ protein YidD